MNLLEYLAIAAALLPVLYIWCKPLGVCAILLAFMVPGYIYVWAGDRDLPLVVGAAPCRRAYCVDTDVSVGVYSRFPVR